MSETAILMNMVTLQGMREDGIAAGMKATWARMPDAARQEAARALAVVAEPDLRRARRAIELDRHLRAVAVADELARLALLRQQLPKAGDFGVDRRAKVRVDAIAQVDLRALGCFRGMCWAVCR